MAIVKSTWRQAAPMADTVSALFYDRLFEIDPGIGDLFDGIDMENQRRKLVQALAMVVDSLDQIDDIVPIVETLGRRHAGYGVTDRHYETVGAALLWTLEKGLSEAWTADVKAAWTTAYTTIANIMRSAAASQDGLGQTTQPRAMIT
jgi:hemoglobin-like flavoprotein